MTTATEDLRAFHGDEALKDKLLERIGAHEKADAIVRGQYWDNDDGEYRGCAVGCSLHDPGQAPIGQALHPFYPERLGLPEWLAHLEDRLFEGMPADKSLEWPRRFTEAIPVGADFDGLADRLAIRRLKEECLPLSGHWPESVKAQVVASIEQTIAALEGKGDREAAAWSAAESAESARSAAESAAESARSAAESAAESAAWSAWSAAESAAWSARSAWSAAESAAWSARSAAESAAWSARSARSARSAAESAAWSAWSAAYEREADRLVSELEALPVTGVVAE